MWETLRAFPLAASSCAGDTVVVACSRRIRLVVSCGAGLVKPGDGGVDLGGELW